MNGLPQDSPVEILRKSLPRGNGQWPGFDHVYRNLAVAAEAMGKNRQTRGGEFHVKTMAVLGSGHEETMKTHQLLLRFYGWL